MPQSGGDRLPLLRSQADLAVGHQAGGHIEVEDNGLPARNGDGQGIGPQLLRHASVGSDGVVGVAAGKADHARAGGHLGIMGRIPEMVSAAHGRKAGARLLRPQDAVLHGKGGRGHAHPVVAVNQQVTFGLCPNVT